MELIDDKLFTAAGTIDAYVLLCGRLANRLRWHLVQFVLLNPALDHLPGIENQRTRKAHRNLAAKLLRTLRSCPHSEPLANPATLEQAATTVYDSLTSDRFLHDIQCATAEASCPEAPACSTSARRAA